MKNTFAVNKIALRRFLLQKQNLLNQKQSLDFGTDWPQKTLQMIKALECVQLDPVSVVERNQHLVLAARMPGYNRNYLNQLLTRGRVFEYFANAACVIPIEDYPIFEPIRSRIQKQVRGSLEQFESIVTSVLKRLNAEGPLPSRAFISKNRVQGNWDNKLSKTKDTSVALSLLVDTGLIRVVHREKTERFFDLTERTISKNTIEKTKSINHIAARKALIKKYTRAYRVFDGHDPRFGWQKMTAAERRAEIDQRINNETVIPLQIDNIKRRYYILAEDLVELESIMRATKKNPDPLKGPITFLPPLDNLLWRRERIYDLFNFSYKWEIYTPQSKRKYGPFTMPILYGDRLIGRIDSHVDRKNEQLNVRLLELEPEVKNTSDLQRNMVKALEDFAEFNQVKKIIC